MKSYVRSSFLICGLIVLFSCQSEELLREDFILSIIDNIKNLGKEKVWDIINHLSFEARLGYLEFYFEALNRLENNYLGDNFPKF